MTSVFLLGRNHQRTLPYQELVQHFAKEGDFLSPDEEREALACYDRDSQQVHTMYPLLVFRPYSLQSIPSFIKACAEKKIPLTARGGGTGRAGCATASQGGIILLTSHFRSILAYDKEQGALVAEPGVTIRQLKQHVQADGWTLPLEMETEGMATLAGCLSTAAKGYHQGHFSMADWVTSMTFIDGTGQEQQAPGALLCGAEGLFGIITELKVKLTPVAQERIVMRFKGSWEEALQMRHRPCVTSVMWQPDQFIVVLSGDKWRMKELSVQGEELLPSDWVLPTSGSSFLLSSFVPLSSMPHLLSDLTKGWYNLLDQSIHLSLSHSLEEFLIDWVHRLEECQGHLISRHGIGPFLRHYMPPFWKEEELRFLKQLQSRFDPSQIFAHNRFFPTDGKSLEKIKDGN